MAMISLLLSISLTASPDLVLPPPVDIGVAPPLPTLAPGLPPATRGDKGTWVPRLRAKALRTWILYARAYPQRIVQPALDAQAAALELHCTARLSLAESRASEEAMAVQEEAAGRWGWPQKILAVAGGVATGMAVGVLAMELAR